MKNIDGAGEPNLDCEQARAEGYRAGLDVGRSVGWVDGFYAGVDVGRRQNHNMRLWYAASAAIMVAVCIGVIYGW